MKALFSVNDPKSKGTERRTSTLDIEAIVVDF